MILLFLDHSKKKKNGIVKFSRKTRETHAAENLRRIFRTGRYINELNVTANYPLFQPYIRR